MQETNPIDLSTILSAAYSNLRPVFREIWMIAFRSLSPFFREGCRGGEQSKPHGVKAIAFREMRMKCQEQTQETYRPYYQSLTAILGLSFRKYGWIGPPSLSRIRGEGQQRQAKPNKPIRIKPFFCNEIGLKDKKQTQLAYPPFYQLLTLILPLIFEKYGWIGSIYRYHGFGSPDSRAACAGG